MKNRFVVRHDIARLYEGFPLERVKACTTKYNHETLEKVCQRLELRKNYEGGLSLSELESDINEIATGVTGEPNLNEVLEIFRELER